LVALEYSNIVIVKEYYTFGKLNNWSGIGSNKVLALANPYYQWAALAGCNQRIGFIAVNYDNTVRSYNLCQR